MKKSYSLFLSVLFLAGLTLQSKAQAIAELNGTCPLSLNSKTLITGGGIGLGFYGNPIPLVKPTRKNADAPVSLRFGGNFYYNGAGQKGFSSVPLTSGTGNASVNFSNSLMGLNTCVRFSSTAFGGRIIPYAEGFWGLRYFSSDLNIDPNDDSESSNSMTLAKTCGMNLGASGGFMIRLSDGFFIDTGVMWSHSELNGEFVDINSLKRIGNSIAYHAEKLPNDFLVFKLGVTGYIDTSASAGNGSNCGNGNGLFDFLEGLFENCGGGGGSGTIDLIKF